MAEKRIELTVRIPKELYLHLEKHWGGGTREGIENYMATMAINAGIQYAASEAAERARVETQEHLQAYLNSGD